MRFLYTLLILLLMPVFAMAEIIPDTIYAVTPNHLCKHNLKENEIIDLYVLKTGQLSDDLNLEQGEKIELKILNYVEPKRGKRSGYFKVEYLGKNVMTGSMKPSTPKDLKAIAEHAGIAVAGQILKVPGFSQAIAVSKGLICPNESESRLESAGKNLYKSTPLTYVEKGSDFEVEPDGVVVIKLKSDF